MADAMNGENTGAANSSPAGDGRSENFGGESFSGVDEKKRLPIGIFDSGVGGLTVLAALLKRLPREHYHYLGDTARLPYGTKSSATIVRYSLQVAEKLVERNIKLLVVGCNTATAAALPHLQKAYPHLPVLGVVEPGARAACKVSRSGRIAVLGTESTIRGQAYTRAIQALRPEARVTGIPCTLFVSLAEEGWMTGDVAKAVAVRYLTPVLGGGFDRSSAPDCLVLGCTHFPPLAPVIQSVVGDDVVLVDSAATTAEAVEERLRELDLLRPEQTANPAVTDALPPAAFFANGLDAGVLSRLHFLTTDAPERFARVGSLFLGMPLDPGSLELVTL